MMMETPDFFKILITSYNAAQHHILEDSNIFKKSGVSIIRFLENTDNIL
jgi:hypothetical protein